MTYIIQQVEGALLGTWLSDFELKQEMRDFSEEMHTRLNRQAAPVYYILDLSEYQAKNFSDILEMSHDATIIKNANFYHPMTRGVIFIAEESYALLAQIADGMNTKDYGYINISVFKTLREGLMFVKQLV